MAFLNSYKVLDEKGSAPVQVQLRYLDPIYPEEYEGMKAAQLAELVKSRIRAAMEKNG